MPKDYKFIILLHVLQGRGIISLEDMSRIKSVDHLLNLLVATDLIQDRDMSDFSDKFISLALRLNQIKSTCPPGSLVENVKHVLDKESWLQEADREFLIQQLHIKNKEN